MTNTASSRVPRWLQETPEQHAQNRAFDKDFLLLPDGQRVRDLRLAGTDVDAYCQEKFGTSLTDLVASARLTFEGGTDRAVELLGRVMSAIKFGEPAFIFNDYLMGIESALLTYAQQDYADAKMQLGLLYCSMGEHFGHSEKEGLVWLKKAFSSDHSDAPSELGIYYLRREQWDKAASYLRKGDRLKCAQSAFQLARMYHEGAGSIEQNLQKAFKLYSQASMRGFPKATVETVELFLTDPNVFQLPAAPEELLREAIADGLPHAMYWLADMFEYGLHVQVDLNEAIALYKEAADLGLGGAQLKMGNIYDESQLDGFSTYKDRELAFHWYQLAANNPENTEVRKRACLALGDIGMATGKYEQAHLWYLNAAHFGSVTAERLAAKAASFRDAQQSGEGEN
ncbi:hypothetical protein AA042_10540 [Pseudomonas lundensis]|uniref:tetratricopeptide repeat protein n=1 Tax=Pseudomonas lundensis TaxID=86185 RepID=UPI0006420EE6|nr:tetratricopeptide repeat protein [Pseudomonas lundensis]AOZ13048.1 hypothetical protein AA042_10540 [Pseudomonas lundensis]QVQ75805.1 sel1 repeat family protein [Pseudomonas lundensis]QVQ81195.1 sel1 repeat family protein [Pseudomonas lundensis]